MLLEQINVNCDGSISYQRQGLTQSYKLHKLHKHGTHLKIAPFYARWRLDGAEQMDNAKA